MLDAHTTARRRAGAALLAALGATLLAGCTSPAPAPEATAPAASPTPTATPTPTASPVSASGTGPGEVELQNPYYPIVEGREWMGMDVSFSCTGDGAFDVRIPGTGAFTGSSTCEVRGSSDFLIEQSETSYRVVITVDEGVDWTFTGLLTPPHGP
ncbi:hypothetical protein ITJ64_03205 [Herbiconiux sp. VKM Ac-1786]|uniref:hypothetical protein n=1 Tax=Herbiconiux sp. VKM Ac-1786 TaxID=2783824 RepID=UPI00188A4739|nr:hypothetical protein [Herbiconiux sp. VKM Ac-1786]MBF4571517.1 hypothetical protein [Herbiconiux sp. VKM Ac-1786]